MSDRPRLDDAWIVQARITPPLGRSIAGKHQGRFNYAISGTQLGLLREAAYASAVRAMPLDRMSQFNAERLIEQREHIVRSIGLSVANMIVDAIADEMEAARLGRQSAAPWTALNPEPPKE